MLSQTQIKIEIAQIQTLSQTQIKIDQRSQTQTKIETQKAKEKM